VNIVLEKHMASREQRTRQKKKEQEEWLAQNYDKLVEYANSVGSSIDTLDAAIEEVFAEDMREIVTGKRSKHE
jgi:hypothetical protein